MDIAYIIGHLYDEGKGLVHFQLITSELRTEYKDNVGLIAELDYMETNFENTKEFDMARDRLEIILNSIKKIKK